MVKGKLLIGIFVVLCSVAYSQVIEADDSNFADKVAKGLSLVAMVASWCGHCKQLHPHFDKASQSLGGVVNLVRIDADQNRGVAGKYEVRGFPTLKYFKDGEVLSDYNGPRSAKGIVDDAMRVFNQQEDNVLALKSLQAAKQFVDSNPGTVKAILFSSKNKNPPLFKSIGMEIDNVDFAWVGDDSDDVKEFFQVSDVPALVVVSVEEGEISDRLMHYDGKLKKYPIREWLGNFEASSKKKTPPPQKEGTVFDKPSPVTNLQTLNEKCKSMCVIGFTHGNKDNENVFKSISKAFIGEGYPFFWVDEDKFDLKSLFNIEENDTLSLVGYRARKRKYSVATNIDSVTAAGKDFFDQIIGGNMRYKRIPKSEL